MGDANITPDQLSGAAGGVGSIMSLIGSMRSADSASTAGSSARAAADYEAAQLEQNAGQAQAAAQREATIERRKTALLISRGLAVAAAGGGATTDPTVSRLLEDIAAEGDYRSGVAIYQGEEKARLQRLQAEGRRMEGANAEGMGESRASAYRMAGFGAALQGASSLYTKYGAGGPKKAAGVSTEWADYYDQPGQGYR